MLTTPKPLKTYTPPTLPTLSEVKNDHDFLKKMPLRWRKCAAVCTAVGLMGSWVLAGCESKPSDGNSDPTSAYSDGAEQAALPPEEHDLEFRAHHGGFSGTPYYIVYLSEQEAFGILRYQLEKAGLTFDGELPDYVAESEYLETEIGVDLFDDERKVAVTYLTSDLSRSGDGWLADDIEKKFKVQSDEIKFGVFYSPVEYADNIRVAPRGNMEKIQPSRRDRAKATKEARPKLEAAFAEQIQEFIEFLEKEGIL